MKILLTYVYVPPIHSWEEALGALIGGLLGATVSILLANILIYFCERKRKK